MATVEVRNVSTFEIDVEQATFLRPQEIRKVERTDTVEAYIADGALAVVETADEEGDGTAVVPDPSTANGDGDGQGDGTADAQPPDATQGDGSGTTPETPKKPRGGGRS